MSQQTREKYAGSELITAIAILFVTGPIVGFSLGYYDLEQRRQAQSEQVTEDLVDKTAEAYLANPFGLELHIKQYQSIVQSEALSEAPDQRQLFALGGQRIAMGQNRLVLIYNAAKSAPEGAEPFLRKNIGNQQAALAATIEQQGTNIPAGNPRHRTAMADLWELELWYRALSAVQTNQPPVPAATDLGAIDDAGN